MHILTRIIRSCRLGSDHCTKFATTTNQQLCLYLFKLGQIFQYLPTHAISYPDRCSNMFQDRNDDDDLRGKKRTPNLIHP